MKQHSIAIKIFFYAALSSCLIILSVIILNAFTSPTSSPEWIYTIEWLNILLIPIPVIVGLVYAGIGMVLLLKGPYAQKISIVCYLCCFAFFVIPFCMPDYQLLGWRWQYFLSACWIFAFLFAGICAFILATHARPLLASILCICGSIFFGLSAMETAMLFTKQYADGMSNLSAMSKHAINTEGIPEYENWAETECAKRPAPANNSLPAFHRLATFDTDLFDVKYSFNKQGWRALPRAKEDPDNDLILFGCSFTFGLGLEDEQTWAWQLAQLLGSNWTVNNYSANGYSANHMVCLLEHGLITVPLAKNRYALFLGIDHQIRRNEFFPNTPHYEFNEHGKAISGGSPRFNWVFNLAHTFNGSQLAREASSFITGIAMKQPEKHIPLYLAMLKKSAQLLHDKYDTQLIVLLWPDLEKIAPQLHEMGIPFIFARSMLPAWDTTPEDPGWKYRIDRFYEPHPNCLAATELADGLARYFRNLAANQQ